MGSRGGADEFKGNTLKREGRVAGGGGRGGESDINVETGDREGRTYSVIGGGGLNFASAF